MEELLTQMVILCVLFTLESTLCYTDTFMWLKTKLSSEKQNKDWYLSKTMFNASQVEKRLVTDFEF